MSTTTHQPPPEDRTMRQDREPHPTHCVFCDHPLSFKEKGGKRRFCSHACKREAYLLVAVLRGEQWPEYRSLAQRLERAGRPRLAGTHAKRGRLAAVLDAVIVKRRGTEAELDQAAVSVRNP